jgi:NADH-quinone oxidoreductase subunit M
VLTLVMGIVPGPVLDVVNPAVERTLEIVGVSDPAPTVDTSEGSQP